MDYETIIAANAGTIAIYSSEAISARTLNIGDYVIQCI